MSTAKVHNYTREREVANIPTLLAVFYNAFDKIQFWGFATIFVNENNFYLNCTEMWKKFINNCLCVLKVFFSLFLAHLRLNLPCMLLKKYARNTLAKNKRFIELKWNFMP